jgi:DNA-binding transcriptional LysR family regulator
MSKFEYDVMEILPGDDVIKDLTTRNNEIVRNLPYFVTVAREQNFRRAASILNITQSALSRRIQTVEYELGVPLFERRAQGVTLTQFGRMLQRDADQLLDQFEGGLDAVRLAARGSAPAFRIGVSAGAARHVWALRALREGQETLDPGGRSLNFAVHRREKLAAALADGSIQAALVESLDAEPLAQGFAMRRVRLETLNLFTCARPAPAAQGGDVLENHYVETLFWSVYETTPRERDRIETLLREAGFRAANLVETPTPEIALNLALAGCGPAVAPASHPAPAGMRACALPGLPRMLALYLAWHPELAPDDVAALAASLPTV